MKKILTLSAFVALAFSQSVNSATSVAMPLTITATVLSSCSVTTGTGISHIGFAPDASTEPTSQADISVLCTAANTPYNILITKGTGPTATVASRQMRVAGAGTPLLYSLYSDPARKIVWGDTIGTDTVTDSSALLPKSHTVYSKIFAGQSVPAGVYSDVVMVSVVY